MLITRALLLFIFRRQISDYDQVTERSERGWREWRPAWWPWSGCWWPGHYQMSASRGSYIQRWDTPGTFSPYRAILPMVTKTLNWQRKNDWVIILRFQNITGTKSGTGCKVIKISLGRLCPVKMIRLLRSQQQQHQHRRQQHHLPCWCLWLGTLSPTSRGTQQQQRVMTMTVMMISMITLSEDKASPISQETAEKVKGNAWPR